MNFIKKGAADLISIIIVIVIVGVLAVSVGRYITGTMQNADEQLIREEVVDAISVIKM